jgi:hypothetical protein
MNFMRPSTAIQTSLFSQRELKTEIADFVAPKTYTGLAGFHKYWGKKPIESICYLIENLTNESDIVMDPFLGSGLISRECLLRNRYFIGIDINPFAIEHASFMLNLPSREEYYQALTKIESSIAEKIQSSYLTSQDKIASHYLWEKNKLVSVWCKSEISRNRTEIEPSDIDFKSYSAYENYKPRNFRNLNFFALDL